MSDWVDLSIDAPLTLRDIYGLPGGPLTVVGDEGAIFRSEDGGATWERVDSGRRDTLHQIAATGEALYVVGCGERSSVVLKSADGRRWKRLKTGRRSYLRAMAAVGDQLIVVGSRHVLRSQDGGASFDVALDSHNSVQSLWCASTGRVLSIGYDDIAVSDDGGASWRHVPNDAQAHLSALDGTPDGQMWAVGYFDVLHSDDSGESWTRLIGEDHGLGALDVVACAPDDVVVVGARGKILSSSDGRTFTREPSGVTGHLLRVQQIGRHVYAVGEGGAVLRRGRLAADPGEPLVRTASKGVPRSLVANATWDLPDPHKKSAEIIEEALAGDNAATRLFLQTDEVETLEPLARAVHLEALTLWGPCPDLSPLAHLPALTELTLKLSPRSLAPLPELPALQSLTLGGTAADLSPLARCPHLTRLDLSDCRKVDLAPLAALDRLEELALPRCAEDLEPLSHLDHLDTLRLSTPPDALEGLELHVKHLYIAARGVDSLEGIEGLHGLRSLNVGGDSVTLSDLTPLAAMGHLESLSLRGANVEDLAPLARLGALRSLDLHDQLVEDLAPLRGLRSLEYLSLDKNPTLSDLSPLCGLSALRSLNLGRTRVQDLSPLSALTHLTHLTVSETRVASIAPLSPLTALESLSFSRTRVDDIAPVGGMRALSSLDLSETKVGDLSPLRGLERLASLRANRLGAVDGAEALATLSSLAWLFVEETTFDTSVLVGLPELHSVTGAAWPPPGANLHGPPPSAPSQALGPGLVFDGRLGVATFEDGHMHDVDLSNDGALVAATRRPSWPAPPGPAAVLRCVDAEPVASFGEGGAVEGVAFDADGQALFYTRRPERYDNTLELWRAPLDGGDAELLLSLTRKTASRLARTADASRLAIISSQVDVVDVASREVIYSAVPADGYDTATAAFHPDGALWIWGLTSGQLSLVDPDTGEVRRTVPAPYNTGQALTVDRDGRFLVAVAHNCYGVHVVDLDAGERLWPQAFRGERHGPAAAVSHDGSLLVELGPQVLGRRLGGDLEPLAGPRLMSSQGRCTAIAQAHEAPMLAFGIGAWRRKDQHLVWVPLVEA